ncbi:MAG: glutathione ABC transporter permease GsiC [Dehalococcoidia bacterium]|nr:glutathione ABC transporter permease GsiC [Dehalococcoidia bacterium]
MYAYILRRVLIAIPTLVGVSLVIFFFMRILPGDVVDAMVTDETGAMVFTEQQRESINESLGLNRPLYVQYGGWMKDVFTGDMGYSFWTKISVGEHIRRRAPMTIEITVLSLIISWVIGLPVGILAAVNRNSIGDYFSRGIVIFFLAVPSFYAALGFLIFFVLVFTWRPPVDVIFFWQNPIQSLYVALPAAVAIGTGMAAVIARMARSSILEVIREDYVRTARSKGLANNVVITKHVLKNALIPVVTISGLQFGNLLSGSIAVEMALSIPGLGALLAQGLADRDWMIIQNLVLIFAFAFIVINLIVDIIYSTIDPRIRYD